MGDHWRAGHTCYAVRKKHLGPSKLKANINKQTKGAIRPYASSRNAPPAGQTLFRGPKYAFHGARPISRKGHTCSLSDALHRAQTLLALPRPRLCLPVRMPYKCAAHAAESESDDEAVGYCCDRCCRFEKSRKIREGREGGPPKIPLIFWRTGESCRCELRSWFLTTSKSLTLTRRQRRPPPS